MNGPFHNILVLGTAWLLELAAVDQVEALSHTRVQPLYLLVYCFPGTFVDVPGGIRWRGADHPTAPMSALESLPLNRENKRRGFLAH